MRDITEQDREEDSELVAAVQQREDKQIQSAEEFQLPQLVNPLKRVRKETVRKESKETTYTC